MNCGVMMPSVDHCLNKSAEMTTLTNSLEVFDTYKHREDEDSDGESFHLPLDDDDSDTKYQDAVVKNGHGNESEDEILNKFESTTPTSETIDSPLEEKLLNDKEEEEKTGKIKENGQHRIENKTEERQKKSKETTESTKKEVDKQTTKTETVNGIINKESSGNNFTKSSKECIEEVETEKKVATPTKDNVPKPRVDSTSNSTNTTEKIPVDKSPNQNKDTQIDVEKSDAKSSLDKSKNCLNVNSAPSNENESKPDETQSNKDECEPKSYPSSPIAHDKHGKCENSNDSSKSPNEDNEDLFDISIIRDAEEDNAESAYNEAHPEDSHIEEEEEERNEDRIEEECSGSDRANYLVEDEEEDEMDIDKHEDQLNKHDDVDIEENKLDCEGIKETASDGESDSGNKTDVVNKEQVQSSGDTVNSVKDSSTKSRLDEVTGKLTDGDSAQTNFSCQVSSDGTTEMSVETVSEDSDRRKGLKRSISEEGESSAVKKSKTEETNVENKEVVELPKEKLPLRTLLSLSEFMKNRKSSKRLTMQDLEEFCLQKICEVIVHKSDLGEVHHQLKLQEQLIEAMRKEIQQLTKQARDLEIVNKKLMNDLKQQNATQKPLNPLKITRSVGLQVKFTPAFDVNMKRRQQNPALAAQKVQTQTTPGRPPRNIPIPAGSGVSRQTSTSQKQPQHQQQQQQQQPPQQQSQPLPKPNTPLLSQALQTRRAAPADGNANKSTSQVIRSKVPDAKSANPSPSVIDLTDEDDKKDKNKTVSPKVIQKNIAVPLRTTPMRVNAAPGIRLTTSQGKVSPITSVVTSSAPQVMYVVQSSPQNLNSSLGPKAVVVNFQPTNGVLSSTLNGSAVSVIPKQANTIQLKPLAPQKSIANNKMVKICNKHPAPLPSPPMVRVSSDKPLKPIPPKPHLTIRKTDTGIILQWKMPYELDMYEVIASYQLYAYQETSAMPSTDMWRKVGDVKALALPMACTLTQFADKNKYYFAVRPVDIHKRIGVFSEPEEISL